MYFQAVVWPGCVATSTKGSIEMTLRIVSAAGETSEQQAARRAAFALAERLDLPVAYLPGSHGGWGSDPQEFAERLHSAIAGRDVENPPDAPTTS